MSVKVTTPQDAEQKEKTFPKLMISSNGKKIVFFLNPNEGVQLNYDDNKKTSCKEPHFSAHWDIQHFTDYNEPITLQND